MAPLSKDSRLREGRQRFRGSVANSSGSFRGSVANSSGSSNPRRLKSAPSEKTRASANSDVSTDSTVQGGSSASSTIPPRRRQDDSSNMCPTKKKQSAPLRSDKRSCLPEVHDVIAFASIVTTAPISTRCRADTDLSEATAPPEIEMATPDFLRGQACIDRATVISEMQPDAASHDRATKLLESLRAPVESRLSEVTVFPEREGVLSDAIDLSDCPAGEDEFSFDMKGRRESLYSETTCSKVEHALENTEELLAKFRTLSIYAEEFGNKVASEGGENASVALGVDESSLRYSPTSNAGTIRLDDDMISSFINFTEEATIDPEVLALLDNTEEVGQLLKTLAKLGEDFRNFTNRGKCNARRLTEPLDAPSAAAYGRAKLLPRTSRLPSTDITTEKRTPSPPPKGSCVESHSSSPTAVSPSAVSPSAVPRGSGHNTPMHMQLAVPNLILKDHAPKLVHRSNNESLSSSCVANGVDSCQLNSPHLKTRACRVSGGIAARSLRAPSEQDSSWNTSCRSPRTSSGSARAIISPLMSPSRSVRVEVQSSPVPSRSASPPRQSLSLVPTSLPSQSFFGGYDRIICRMRQAASPDSESSVALQHSAQSAASRIVQSAFGACGPSTTTRRAATNSPIRNPIQSPGMRTRVLVPPTTQSAITTPRIVPPVPWHGACLDTSSTMAHPGILPTAVVDKGRQYIWEPVSVTTAYRLRPVN